MIQPMLIQNYSLHYIFKCRFSDIQHDFIRVSLRDGAQENWQSYISSWYLAYIFLFISSHYSFSRFLLVLPKIILCFLLNAYTLKIFIDCYPGHPHISHPWAKLDVFILLIPFKFIPSVITIIIVLWTSDDQNITLLGWNFYYCYTESKQSPRQIKNILAVMVCIETQMAMLYRKTTISINSAIM